MTWKLWKATTEIDAYKNQTLILILPDHGRELDRPNSPGYVHHSDFYTDTGADEGCRRVWILVLGPRTAPDQKIATPIPLTAAAATGLEYLNLASSLDSEKSIWNYTV